MRRDRHLCAVHQAPAANSCGGHYVAYFQTVQYGFFATPFTKHPPLTAAALDLTDEIRAANSGGGHYVA